MKCLHCGHENVVAAQFCVCCGKPHNPQARETQGRSTCSCGTLQAANARFCTNCGLRQTPISEEAGAPKKTPLNHGPMLSSTSELDVANTVSGKDFNGTNSIIISDPIPTMVELDKVGADSDTIEGDYTEGLHLLSDISMPSTHPRIVERVVRTELADAILEMQNELLYPHHPPRRKNVAHWVIRNETLYLARIDGRRGVMGKELLIAEWVSERIQLGRRPVEVDPIWGSATGSATGCELEVVCGRILRHREINTSMSSDGPVLEELPGGQILFAHELSINPLNSRPTAQQFEGVELRKVCSACRSEAGLSHGDLAERIGMKRGNGGALAEWERGLRDLQKDRLDAVCRVLGIDVDEVSKREHATFEAAQKAWFEAPIRPWLTMRGRHYEFPDAFAPSVDAEAWARRCVHLAWASGTLHIDRYRMVEISAQEELEARPLPPEVEVLLTGRKLKSAKDEH